MKATKCSNPPPIICTTRDHERPYEFFQGAAGASGHGEGGARAYNESLEVQGQSTWSKGQGAPPR